MSDLTKLLDAAVAGAPALAASSNEQRNGFILGFAERLEGSRERILEINAGEVEAGKAAGLSAPLVNRLDLSGASFDSMIGSLQAVAALEDPIGAVFGEEEQPSGITVGRMRVPLGVVCFIYESRPNVTADGAALCLKSGNTAILRGGRESLASNMAIAECAAAALERVGLPAGVLGLVPTPDRTQMELLLADPRLDLVIPRGGAALVEHVQNTALAPVLSHLYGNCHVYIDSAADPGTAVAVAVDSKSQRPETCNATESLVIHADRARDLLPRIAEGMAGVELRGCERTCEILGERCSPASESDWDEEYLGLVLSVKVIDSLDEAIEWINVHGSNHTDAIVTSDAGAASRFCREIDSASVMVNTSTRFADGFEFGLGAETGISTDKLHARGPVGLEGLTSVKFVVRSDGRIRG